MRKSSLLKHLAPSALLTLLGFLLAYQFVDPAPPNHFSIGSGNAGGAYHLFAERYRDFLAKEQVRLEVRETAGSTENIALLKAKNSGVEAALVQSGTAGQLRDDPELYSLGSLFFEPLWVFYRGEDILDRLPALAGKRIAIGPDGSGTQSLARELLGANAIESQSTQLLPLGTRVAVEQLLAGEIDVLFMVASPKSDAVATLLRTPGVRLMSFERAEAYTRNYRALSRVVLPEGAIDLKANIPAADTVLLAAAANLVVRRDLHPALVDLLLQAAQLVHSQGGWFERQAQFPTAQNLEFELSPDARRFYQYGAPFLQRYLPFWAASFVDRMKVMLLPLVALLLPLLKIMPPLYRWRMRSRVYRWYRQLQDIDLGLFVTESQAPDRYRVELDRIEEEVANVDVPLSFADELFNLRLHIELIRRRLETRERSDRDREVA